MSERDSRDGLDAYGRLATLGVDPTIQSGRYAFQAEAERLVFLDVLPKIQVEPHHDLLDIGCGAGLLTIPLSFLARTVTALDHVDTIAALERRYRAPGLTYLGGRFPEVRPSEEFDRIVAYSVVPAIETYQQVKEFALAAARLLRPGGRFLLGDIPNRDRQQRFRESEAGKRFEVEWSRLRSTHIAASEADQQAEEELAQARQLGSVTDEQMVDLLLTFRANGFDAYLVEQQRDLPFGRTREDIIVTRA